MEKKYCFNCGREIKEDTKFCPYCGTNQSKGEKNSQQDVQQSQSSINSQQFQQQSPQQYAKPQKHTSLVAWGWVLAVLSIFIPGTAIVSFIFGVRAHKYPAQSISSTILMIVSVITLIVGIAIYY